jgi:hypothetical protein
MYSAALLHLGAAWIPSVGLHLPENRGKADDHCLWQRLDVRPLSLTPAFKPVTRREIDISRFNGLSSRPDVRSFLFSLLDSLDLENSES